MSAAARSSGPRFSPRARFCQVPPAAIQASLRSALARWGRPERLRVDNGTPWGSRGDWPPDLALWLIGLGVAMVWNPPRRPQCNGVVERSQGTAKRWAEPGACADERELQRRLEEMDEVQREYYPNAAGRSRREAFTGLAHSGRPYSRRRERGHWDLGKVAAHLAGYATPRRVGKSGMVSIYNRNLYVGLIHKRQTVYVTFDPERLEWVTADAAGWPISRQPAGPPIDRETIVGLRVTNRRRGSHRA